VLNLDSAPDDKVMEELRADKDIVSARILKL